MKIRSVGQVFPVPTGYTRRSIGMRRGEDGPITLLAVVRKSKFLAHDGQETSTWQFAYPLLDEEEERKFASKYGYQLIEGLSM